MKITESMSKNPQAYFDFYKELESLIEIGVKIGASVRLSPYYKRASLVGPLEVWYKHKVMFFTCTKNCREYLYEIQGTQTN
jgi:hypothetical protein